MEFAPHGDASIDLRGRVLVFRPKGYGNAEEMQRVLGEVRRLLPSFAGQPWGALLLAQASPLLTPEAEQLLAQMAPGLVASGQTGFAIAGARAAEAWLIQAQFTRIYAGTPCPLRLFDDEASAEHWLQALAAG